jgi:hypothetical protein
MHMSGQHYLLISPELRQAVTSLQANFGTDYWEDKFESVDEGLRSKYQALVGAMYKFLDRVGTEVDFVTMREACVPTEWLVLFLSSWKLSVDQTRQEGKSLVTFIQGVIDKVGKTYILIDNNTTEGRHTWRQLSCMSSLLLQLKTLSD